jgi:hypothetical protein
MTIKVDGIIHANGCISAFLGIPSVLGRAY